MTMSSKMDVNANTFVPKNKTSPPPQPPRTDPKKPKRLAAYKGAHSLAHSAKNSSQKATKPTAQPDKNSTEQSLPKRPHTRSADKTKRNKWRDNVYQTKIKPRQERNHGSEARTTSKPPPRVEKPVTTPHRVKLQPTSQPFEPQSTITPAKAPPRLASPFETPPPRRATLQIPTPVHPQQSLKATAPAFQPRAAHQQTTPAFQLPSKLQPTITSLQPEIEAPLRATTPTSFGVGAPWPEQHEGGKLAKPRAWRRNV